MTFENATSYLSPGFARASSCELVEIRHNVFGRLLKSRPTLAVTLSDLMAKRRMKTEDILSR
jgi:hypothetical protein